MFLPLSDSPNPRGTPVVTYALIAANVAVYLLLTLPLSSMPADRADPALNDYLRVIGDQIARGPKLREILEQVSQYDLFVFEHGFRPAAPHLGALFVSIFLHANFLHLFGNMLFLWIYGDNVEQRLGHGRYLFWYMTTGVAATLFHAAFFRQSQLPLVGASGAISGVLGFYFLWFPYNQVRLLVWWFPFYMRVISLSARFVLGVFILLDNLLPFLLTRGNGGAGVAFGAHIGGFLTGLSVAWWTDYRKLSAPAGEYISGVKRDESDRPAGDRLREAIDQHRMAEAAQLYLSLSARHSRRLVGAEELLGIGHWLLANDRPRAALAVFLRLLRDYPRGSYAAEAHLRAGLILLQHLGEDTAAYQHFVDALESDPTPTVEHQARAALQGIAARQKFKPGRTGFQGGA